MTGFLSCRNASMDIQPWRVFQMTLETPEHAGWSQVKLKAKNSKLTTPAPPHKVAGESSGSILREEGRDPGLQE